MDFFIDESCGSCTLCRNMNVILRNRLLKILGGKGTRNDLKELDDWSRLGKSVNRCGLGQTAANPIITTIENFKVLYTDLIKTDADYLSMFDLEQAVAESCETVGRELKIKDH